MIIPLLLTATVIFACVICNRVSHKLGVPMLLAFILLGVVFGSDGIFKIPFDNYFVAEKICSVALIFIMFYGGFGTKWSQAKPVAVKALVLSSAGTVATAGILGLFCHFVLKIAILESFLIGAVISSTDAASVFSVLRSRRLNLRYNTASLLELESGSNDPFSYMLTIIILSLMNGKASFGEFAYMLFAQIAFGVLFGVVISLLALLIIRKFKFTTSGFDAVFIVAVALIAYALPALLGGNGYLSAYITGIILGNNRIGDKKVLVNFFDGITGLMQMLLFFLLGLLSFPSQLPEVAGISILIALFLTFVARPIAVFSILSLFKSKVKQQLLVSWAGMRGAASIVFAIMAVINPAVTDNDIFHIVFFTVLFSILLQGTLLPFIAKILKMTDKDSDVMKTFTDYKEELPVEFIQFTIPEGHIWIDKPISEITMPPDSLIVLLQRDGKGSERFSPNGNTVLMSGDTVILSGKSTDDFGTELYEKLVEKDDKWANKALCKIPFGDELIIMIQRGKEVIIPNGDTIIQVGDVLVINENG